MDSTTIRLTLNPLTLGRPLSVQLRRAGGRWVARVDGGESSLVGMSASAGRALAGALEPLGESVARVLLADLALLEPSCQVLEMERGVAG
jgi:hypothetical protein